MISNNNQTDFRNNKYLDRGIMFIFGNTKKYRNAQFMKMMFLLFNKMISFKIRYQ